MEDFLIQFVSTLAAVMRVATPLVLCAMAGLYSERSGIIDIGLEGKMLAAAFAAAVLAFELQSPWLGLAGGIITAILLSLLHGFACITNRGDQVVSGVAINISVSGLTVVLGNAWYHQGGQTPNLPNDVRFSNLQWPFLDQLNGLPFLGQLYKDVISGHSILTYAALLIVPFTYWILYKTRFGLRLRAVGEKPQVVDTAGISVTWLRYRAVIITGILCGIAGTYLSISQGAGFGRDMTAGRGYIALAAMIFGKWRPWPAFWACLLFALMDAIAIRLEGLIIPGIGAVPVTLIQAMPYILTVVLLAGFIGRAIAPKAIGIPYVKER